MKKCILDEIIGSNCSKCTILHELESEQEVNFKKWIEDQLILSENNKIFLCDKDFSKFQSYQSAQFLDEISDNFLEDSSSCKFCGQFANKNTIQINHEVLDMLKQVTGIMVQLDCIKSDSEYCCKTCYNDLNTCLRIKKKFLKLQDQLLRSSEDIKEEVEQDLLTSIEIKEEHLEDDYDDNFVDEYKDKESEKNSLESDKKKQERSTTARMKYLRAKSPCPDCGVFLARNFIQRHRKNVHQKIKEFICDICGREFSRKCRVLDHLRTHFKFKDKICSICGMAFSTSGTLYTHKQKIHKKKYTRCCDICGKSFQCKTYFDTHMRSKHLGDRSFKCDEENCEKAYFSYMELRTHKKASHWSESIQCTICFKTYKSDLTYKVHMKQHAAPKFICDFENCEKTFFSNSRLTQHINLAHRGIKKYSCSICAMKFGKPKYLTLHVKNIHEKLKIKCEICSTLLGSKQYYRKHVMEHHQELNSALRDNLLEKIKMTKEMDLFNHQK